jgi:hypothetical protein
MSVSWHYIQNGSTHGPIPEEQLRELIASGALLPSDQVWREGMGGWNSIQAIPELFALAPQGRPPLQIELQPQPPAAIRQPTAPPKKSNKVLLWVLGGCGGLVLLVLIGMLVSFLWVKEKVGRMQRNPAVAAAELIVRANPELEVTATDYTKGTITVRNKKSGETLTMDANDVKQGRLSFKDDKGSEVQFNAPEGGAGAVQIQGPNGQTTFGAGTKVQVPSWLPTYPGAPVEGLMNATSKEGTTGTIAQKTADSTAQVISVFEKNLKAGGFEVSTIRNPEGGIVVGEHKAPRRHVMVSIGPNQGQTVATINFREQN